MSYERHRKITWHAYYSDKPSKMHIVKKAIITKDRHFMDRAYYITYCGRSTPSYVYPVDRNAHQHNKCKICFKSDRAYQEATTQLERLAVLAGDQE